MVSPVSSRAEHSDMSRKLSIEEAGAEERDLVTGIEEIIGQPDMEIMNTMLNPLCNYSSMCFKLFSNASYLSKGMAKLWL